MRIILSQPNFKLRPMPKYSDILNFGIRRSFNFDLFSSLVNIFNQSLGYNLKLTKDSWCQKRILQYPTCPEYIETKFSISYKYYVNLSLLYYLFVLFQKNKYA